MFRNKWQTNWIGLIEFKNNFKQLAIPFKIYAHFESVLKEVKSNDRHKSTSNTKKYHDHIPFSFGYKVVCIRDKFSKQFVFHRREKMQSIGLLKQFLKIMIMILEDYDYYDNVTKNHFNKSLAMSTEDEQRFKSRNKCWICDKIFDVGDTRVRDNFQVTRRCRGSAH